MQTYFIILPCTARELEAALHAYCDHGGLWDAEVQLCLHKPQNIYVLELLEPNEEKKGETK